MKKLVIAFALSAMAILAAPSTAKADPAINAATNYANMQHAWLNNQWSYFTTYEVPAMTQYTAAMMDQYAQATAAKYQSDLMANQARMMAAANAYQLYANEYAHQQNLATQYTNMKNMATYNAINNWDTSYYANHEAVLRTYAMMFGQYPFPQVQ